MIETVLIIAAINAGLILYIAIGYVVGTLCSRANHGGDSVAMGVYAAAVWPFAGPVYVGIVIGKLLLEMPSKRVARKKLEREKLEREKLERDAAENAREGAFR